MSLSLIYISKGCYPPLDFNESRSFSFSCQMRYNFTIYLQLVLQIQDMLTQSVQFPFERPIHRNLQLLELPWSAKYSWLQPKLKKKKHQYDPNKKKT